MSAKQYLMAVVVAAGVSNAFANVQNGFVDGLINVQARQHRLVSNEYGNSFFPGHRLTIKLSGSVDINWYERWEEECFIGICKRRTWIEHNWVAAERWPVEFQLVDENETVLLSAFSQNGTASITVPIDGTPSSFNKRYMLRAIVSDGSPPIDAARSQGQFNAQIIVDTSERLARLPSYLSQAKPVARDLKERWVNDPFLIEQNRAAVARALINLAQTAYPPNSPLNAEDHRALLDYAGEIDQGNTAVGSAVADLYIQQGDFSGAEKELVQLIKTLRQAPNGATDPGTQLELARTHLKLAATIQSARGHADAKDLSAIWGHYSAVIQIAEAFRAPGLQAEALIGRAYSHRIRNTIDSLKAAQEDFRRARDLTAQAFLGLPIDAAPGGDEILINQSPSKSLVSWRPAEGTAANPLIIDGGQAALRPLAVTDTGKVYATTGSNIGTIRLTDPAPAYEPILTTATDVFTASTNGRYSVVSRMAPTVGALPLMELLREQPGALPRLTPINVDGKPAVFAEVAGASDRYIALGEVVIQPPNPVTQAFELREISGGVDAVVRRVTLPPGLPFRPLAISADGRRVLALILAHGPGPLHKLIVWDDQGGAVEVMNKPLVAVTAFGPDGRTPVLPPDQVLAASFSPDSAGVVLVKADGSVWRGPITANANFTQMDRPASMRAAQGVGIHRISRVNAQSLLIEGSDSQGVFHQLVSFGQAPIRLFRGGGAGFGLLSAPIGYWANSQGILGAVQFEPAPFALRSINLKIGKVTAAGKFLSDKFTPLRLLKGGRYVCSAGNEIGVKDLSNDSYAVIAQKPTAVMPDVQNNAAPIALGTMREVVSCLPRRDADSWLLIRQVAGAIKSAVPYRGQQPLGENVMPAVPQDIIDREMEASQRLNVPYQPPSFYAPYAGGMPGQNSLESIGAQFSAAYPRLAGSEAFNKPDQWISIPYVMLQEPAISLKRMRLPLGALAMAVLPDDKVIYVHKMKVWWKPLSTDTNGKLLFELLTAPPPAIAPFLAQIIFNPEGTRVIFGSQAQSQLGVLDVEQKLFEITNSDIRPLPCTPCARRSIDATKLLAGTNLQPFAFPVFLVDGRLDRIVIYRGDQATIHSLSTNKQVAAIPFRQVFWLSENQVFFVDGPNDYSVLSY